MAMGAIQKFTDVEIFRVYNLHISIFVEKPKNTPLVHTQNHFLCLLMVQCLFNGFNSFTSPNN